MGTLYVVRHAQASFFEADYDRLSEIGRVQARRLGQYWLRRGVPIDAVYSGPRARQIDTAAIVGEEFRAAGRQWPETTVCPEFDEYAAEAVLKNVLPQLIEADAHVHQLHAAIDASASRAEQLRTFQRMYEVVIGRWSEGQLALDGVESWPDFRQRVHHGLDQITGGAGSGQRVALFTSGGPIGVAVERALETPSPITLRTAWMVRNGSISEFLFSGQRFTLSQFNTLAHLEDDPNLLTYR